MSPRLTRSVVAAMALLSAGVAANTLLLQRAPALRGERADPVRTAALTALPRSDTRTTTTSSEPTPVREVLQATERRVELNASHLAALDPVTPELVRAIQRELLGRGFDPGSVDGQLGTLTRAAILAFEYEHGLALTGEPSEQLLRRIVLGQAGDEPATRMDARPGAATVKLVRSIQQALAALNYAPGAADGTLRAETVRAIREFEMDQGLAPTGRITGRLVGRLVRVAGRHFELPPL